MTATVKDRIGLTVPPSVQHKAGFKTGDVVEFKVFQRRDHHYSETSQRR